MPRQALEGRERGEREGGLDPEGRSGREKRLKGGRETVRPHQRLPGHVCGSNQLEQGDFSLKL